MDAAARIMLLPIEAQKRFERVAEENRQLKSQIEAQKIVISDLSQSLDAGDDAEKLLQALNDQLTAVTQGVANSSALLLEPLSESLNRGSPPNTGELLKTLVGQVQSVISDLAVHGVAEGSMSVSIIKLIELEEQIRKIIDDLQGRGLYPESDQESQARLLAMQKHTGNILKFMEDVLKEAGEE
jgi:hypothetical protein